MGISAAFFLLGVPGLIWAVSYFLLVREFGRINLLSVKIHESGKFSLLETIFYYNHFLRELPIDTLFGFAVLWSYSAAGLQFPGMLPGRAPSAILAGLLVLFLLAVGVGSLRTVGLKATWMDLLQLRERDDLVGWGSHWQMHFLSTAALLLLFILPGTLFHAGALPIFGLLLLWGSFLGLSILFKTDLQAVRERRWMLHGAREVFTYFFIVAIPAFVPLIMRMGLERIMIGPASALIVVIFLGINLYFIRVYRQGGVDKVAQSDRGLLYLISSHFFEHVLDYVYILLLVMAAGAWEVRP